VPRSRIVKLHRHSQIRLHGVVLKELSIGATAPCTLMKPSIIVSAAVLPWKRRRLWCIAAFALYTKMRHSLSWSFDDFEQAQTLKSGESAVACSPSGDDDAAFSLMLEVTCPSQRSARPDSIWSHLLRGVGVHASAEYVMLCQWPSHDHVTPADLLQTWVTSFSPVVAFKILVRISVSK
jgi:hypothetical protein